jgi:hypothetical protein
METLFDKLKSIIKDESAYYYNKYSYNNELENLINNNSEAINFIMEYFYTGGKSSLFSSEQEFVRAKHVIMSYFLGVMIIKNTNLKSKFDEYVKNDLSNIHSILCDGNDNILYLWYLASLFHDIGYVFENKITTSSLAENEKSDIFLNSTTINGHLYQFKMNTNRYPINTYQKYYLYIFKNLKIQEHGFLGGNMLFNRMKKNLLDKIKNESLSNSSLNTKSFISDGLHWSINHLDIYRMLSFVIMEHNIWRLEDESLAREYGLDNLYLDNYERIDPEREPLLFLLSLVDTIEPFKKFDKQTNKIDPNFDVFLNFLKNTKIDFGENKIRLSNTTEDILFREMENSLNGMEKWMKVKLRTSVNVLEISW